jgi:tripartite-type tricarboxylate transporter receptor subunit TctC
MRHLFHRALLGLAVCALPAVTTAALAQDYPNKPIRVVVPFPAGGPNDIIARVVGKAVSDAVKQPVVIDNRGGAGGLTGTDNVAKSAPDGYSLAITSSGALAINPSLQPMPYDVGKDLALITQVVAVPEILVVHPDVKANTLADIVALAKAQPGKLNFASTGSGGMPHLAAELLKFSANINMVHVPYRGAAPAVTDLLGGHVQMMFADIPVLLPHVQAGKLRAIAVGSKQRAKAVPDVPTTTEAGFPQVEADNWYGLVGPSGMPQPLVDRIHTIFVAAIRNPEVGAQLSAQGATMIGNTQADFTNYVRGETAKWKKVIEISGAKPD